MLLANLVAQIEQQTRRELQFIEQAQRAQREQIQQIHQMHHMHHMHQIHQIHEMQQMQQMHQMQRMQQLQQIQLQQSQQPSATPFQYQQPQLQQQYTDYVNDEGRCFACGDFGHLLRDCPVYRSWMDYYPGLSFLLRHRYR